MTQFFLSSYKLGVKKAHHTLQNHHRYQFQFQFQRPQISVMQAAPGMMLVPAEGAGPNGPYMQVPAPEGGGDAPEGGQQQVVVVAEGKGGRRYQDIDAPKSNRVVLDYGDI